MVMHRVWEPVSRQKVKNKNVLIKTWEMKKKANGKFRARIYAREYKQQERIHFKSNSIAVPGINEMTIKIVMVIMLMAK